MWAHSRRSSTGASGGICHRHKIEKTKNVASCWRENVIHPSFCCPHVPSAKFIDPWPPKGGHRLGTPTNSLGKWSEYQKYQQITQCVWEVVSPLCGSAFILYGFFLGPCPNLPTSFYTICCVVFCVILLTDRNENITSSAVHLKALIMSGHTEFQWFMFSEIQLNQHKLCLTSTKPGASCGPFSCEGPGQFSSFIWIENWSCLGHTKLSRPVSLLYLSIR